jgi:hypothetical protein
MAVVSPAVVGVPNLTQNPATHGSKAKKCARRKGCSADWITNMNYSIFYIIGVIVVVVVVLKLLGLF